MAREVDGEIIVGIDQPASKQVMESDLKLILSQIQDLEAKISHATLEQSALDELQKQLDTLKTTINVANIKIDQQQTARATQQIATALSTGIGDAAKTASQELEKTFRNFSELNDFKRQFVNKNELISKEEIADAERFYDVIKKTFSDFGQVTVTKGELEDGDLKSLRVKIQQVNGELKTTRDFMLYLKSLTNGQGFKLTDDGTIRTTEKLIQHLNEEKNIIDATGDEINAQKQRLAEQTEHYKSIKNEISNLYQLQEKLLSADKLQSAELEKQIEDSKKLISYNQQELDNKGLRDNGLDEEIINLEIAKQKRLEVTTAKLQDAAAAKAVAQAEREAAVALKEEESIAEQVRQIMSYMDGTDSKSYDLQLATQIKNYQNLGFTEEEVAQKTENLRASYENLKSVINSTNYDSVTEKNKAIVSANEEYTKSLNQVSNAYKALKKDTEQYYNESKQINLTNKIQRWLSANTNASNDAKQAIQGYYNELSNGRVSVERLSSIEKALKQIDTTQRGLGKISNFVSQWGKNTIAQFTSMAAQAVSFTKIFSTVKQGITNITELDTSLIDLRKTASMTNSELENFYYASNDVAKQMGVSTKEIIDQASSWSRLGYSTAEAATQMAKISSQFKLISPGMSADEATSGLVSIMKAYDIDVNNVLDGIMSKVNTIGNKFALSNADIVAMLQDSVSAMKEANNSLEETIALETAAYEITQDRSVGNGFKTKFCLYVQKCA